MSDYDLIPLTFLVPPSTNEPMVIELIDQPLRMVVVDKESVGLLGREWDIAGLYFLFGSHPEGSPKYTAYVGKSPAGLRGRISTHARTREEPWDRALLMTSAADLDSTAIGWLEGRLHGVLDAAVHCDITNRNRPGDDTLPPFRRNVLEQYVAPIAAAMRALGYSPDTPDQHHELEAEVPELDDASASPAAHVSLPDLVRQGLVAPGTVLRSRPSTWDVRATVTESGDIDFDGSRFNSPSMAAVAATGSQWNGWVFWGIPSGDGTLTPLDSLRSSSQPSDAESDDTMVRFWTRMLETTDVRSVIGDRTGPRKDPWTGYSVVSGVEYNFYVGARQSRVELLFRRRVRHWYDEFESRYRSKLPAELVWSGVEGSDTQARISLTVAGGRRDEGAWRSLQENLVEEMRRLQEILGRPLQELLDSKR